MLWIRSFVLSVESIDSVMDSAAFAPLSSMANTLSATETVCVGLHQLNVVVVRATL